MIKNSILIFSIVLISLFWFSFSVWATEWVIVQSTSINTNDKLYKTLLKSWPLTLRKLQQTASKNWTTITTVLQETIIMMQQKEKELLSKKKKISAKRYTYLIDIAQKELEKYEWIRSTSDISIPSTQSDKNFSDSLTTTNIPYFIDLTKRSTWVRWIDDWMRMWDGWDGYIYYFEWHLSPTDTTVAQDNSKYFYIKDIWSINLYAWTTWIVYWRLTKSWLIKVSKQWMSSKVQEKHYWNLMQLFVYNYDYYKRYKWMNHSQAITATANKFDEIYNEFSQFQSESDNDTKIYKVYKHILVNYLINFSVDLNQQWSNKYLQSHPNRLYAVWVFDTKDWVCSWLSELYHLWLIFANIDDKIATKQWRYPETGNLHIYLVIWWRESDITVNTVYNDETPFVIQDGDNSSFGIREF